MRALLAFARQCSAVSAAALTAGCATTVVVPPAPVCKLPAVLMQPCVPLAQIPAGTSYGELLKIYQGERKNLALCSGRQRDLAEAIAGCNSELSRYNERIEAERAKARGR